MGKILRDIAILLFNSNEIIHDRAEEIRNDRLLRSESFQRTEKKKEKFHTLFSDGINKALEGIFEIREFLGVASKNEINEIKILIKELQSRIDELHKN